MSQTSSRFAHHRLDAYGVAVKLVCGVEALAARSPRGHADLKDQVRRSASATLRHIAEGANRTHPKDKASRFMVARGEVGECDALIELAAILGLCDAPIEGELRRYTDRVAAMLWGLVRRERQRAGLAAFAPSGEP